MEDELESATTTIDILWDGDVLLAVDKPAGLPTQAPSGCDSLENRLRKQLGARAEYLAFPHRLDRPVSGIVLAALRKKAARLLSEQFASRKVDKQYLAVVSGQVDPAGGLWIDSLRKIPDQAKVEMVDSGHPDGKRAQTRVEVVRFNPELDRSLVKLHPHTGRMHQLRVQAAGHGHPIVGDPLYGGQPIEQDTGILLRAQSLTFHDPRNGRRITLTASATFDHRV